MVAFKNVLVETADSSSEERVTSSKQLYVVEIDSRQLALDVFVLPD